MGHVPLVDVESSLRQEVCVLKKKVDQLHGLVESACHRFRGYLPHDEFVRPEDVTAKIAIMFCQDTLKAADRIVTE